MAKTSNMPSETTMYSINPANGAVLVHHLPWPNTSPQLKKYVDRGFTFERPDVEQSSLEVTTSVTDEEPRTCPVCGKLCKSEFGLRSHMRSHKEAV